MRIRHSGLRRLARDGSAVGVPAASVPRLRRILTVLASASSATDAAHALGPGYRPHMLRGDMAGYWSVRVTGNWRVVFRYDAAEAVDVDLVDYH